GEGRKSRIPVRTAPERSRATLRRSGYYRVRLSLRGPAGLPREKGPHPAILGHGARAESLCRRYRSPGSGRALPRVEATVAAAATRYAPATPEPPGGQNASARSRSTASRDTAARAPGFRQAPFDYLLDSHHF